MTLGTLFTALGFLVGGLVFWLAARERRLATNGMTRVVLIGVTAGVVGAKLSQVAIAGSWEALLDPRTGGRALLGGVIFGWLGVELAKRQMGIRRSTGDMFALALPAGEAIGRIGCHFNGCCYGAACDLPWAIDQHGALRHPSQLYSAVAAAALFGVLLGVRKRLTHEGDLFKLYLAGFAALRFVLEFFRYHESTTLGLSLMQWLCLEILVSLGIWAVIAVPRRRARIDGGDEGAGVMEVSA
jgi:phosphatidylglycerol---prolipoprotein diacylglyceryl transferase